MGRYSDHFRLDELVGKTLVNAVADHDSVRFLADDGVEYVFCCGDEDEATVTVDDICGNISDLVGSPILKAEVSTRDGRSDKCWSGTWSFYAFSTANGAVDIRWFGTSGDGCYETVDHTKVAPPFPIKKGVSERLDKMVAPVVFVVDIDVVEYSKAGFLDTETRVEINHGGVRATVGTMVVDGVRLPVISNRWVNDTFVADLDSCTTTCEIKTPVFGYDDTVGKMCRKYTVSPGDLVYQLKDFGIEYKRSCGSAYEFMINKACSRMMMEIASFGSGNGPMSKYRPIRVEEPKKKPTLFSLGFAPESTED